MSQKFLNPIEVDGQVSAEYLDLSTTTSHSVNAGEIAWNSVDGTFDIGLLNGVILQAGQEMHFYGKATEAISNGNAVMFAGVQGDHILIAKATPAAINANPEYFMGVATQDFTTNQFGYVTAFGNVRGLNTTGYTLGTVLYFDSNPLSSPGLLTGVKPTAPNAKVEVAAVVKVHATQGILMVRPHTMPKLSDVQDVKITGISINDILYWTTANRWENGSVSTVLGYTPANSSHTHTFDSLTSKTGGTGTYQTSGDFRAPIFYDSNNTGYYLDPASTSNLYNVTAKTFVKSGGTSSQFLKADGSVDSNTYLTSVTNITGYSGTLISEDNRTISPSELAANRLKFGFTSWNNNNTSPYADFIHLRSYQDASGGSDNLVMFKKSGIGMRIWQQTYGSTTAYSTYKDIAFTDGTNATGTWSINITGNSGYANSAGTAETWGGYYLPTINNWNTNSSQDIVVGQLAWKAYGNGYTIFDASSGLAPDNFTNVNQADADFIWTTAQPTLMGWDGSNTYGIRVDTSRYSDVSYSAIYANSAGSVSFNNLTNKTLGTGTYQTSGDFRAPIFYDSDNTGFYSNPAGLSNFSTIIGNSIQVHSTTPVLTIQDTDSSGASQVGYISYRNTGGVETAWLGFGSASDTDFTVRNTLGRVLLNGTYSEAVGDFRAPIFYDSNNTSYYFDGSSTGDSIRCAGDIVAYYSDERLKDKKGNIENALEKVLSLNGFYYTPNDKAQELGYKYKEEVGVSAQEVEEVLPQIIKDAPIGQGYKTLDYGKLTPLLIEAIKEQQKQIEELKELVNKLITK